MTKTNKPTKAERIFANTRYACYDHIKTWGAERENGRMIGFNRCDYEDDECMTQRTINALRALLASAKKTQEQCLNLKIIDETKYRFEMDILEMVEVTIDNNEKSMKA